MATHQDLVTRMLETVINAQHSQRSLSEQQTLDMTQRLRRIDYECDNISRKVDNVEFMAVMNTVVLGACIILKRFK